MVAAIQAAKKAQTTLYVSILGFHESRCTVTEKLRVNANAGQTTILAKNKEVKSVETFPILALLD